MHAPAPLSGAEEDQMTGTGLREGASLSWVGSVR